MKHLRRFFERAVLGLLVVVMSSSSMAIRRS